MFARSLTQTLRSSFAAPVRRNAMQAARSARVTSVSRSYSAVRFSSVRAVGVSTLFRDDRTSRFYSTEEVQQSEQAEETVSGQDPSATASAEEQPTGGPFRVMLTNVPMEALNRDVRIFLSRAGTVCWIRRVRPEDNNGQAAVIAEYLHEAEAEAAIEQLNGEEMEGETLTVQADTSGLVMQLPTRLLLKNLPYSYDEFQIRELVAGFEIAWVNLVNNERGFSGMATVKFPTQQEAKRAMAQLINAEVEGRRLIPSFQGSTKRSNDGARGGDRRQSYQAHGDRDFRRRDNNRGGYQDRRQDRGDNANKSGYRERRFNNTTYFGDE